MGTRFVKPANAEILSPPKTTGRVKAAWAVLVFVSLLRQQSGLAGVEDKNGLSLEIRCTNDVLKVGDEIPVEFILSNHGPADYKYTDRNYDRGGRMGEYKLAAKTASGESVPDARLHFRPGMGGGLGQPRLLHPDESFSKVIALNLWALITEPGRYKVMGVYEYDPGYSTSDPISITVLPRTKAEMHDYIQGFTNNAGPPGMSED